MTTSLKLYDAAARHAVFLEGLKNGAALGMRPALRVLNTELFKLFEGQQFENMGSLNKRQVLALQRQVAQLVRATLDPELARLLEWLKAFTAVEGQLYGGILADVMGQPEPEEQDAAFWWRLAGGALLAGAGMTAAAALTDWRNRVAARVILTVNSAYVQNVTRNTLISSFTSARGRAGLILASPLEAQLVGSAAAVSETIMGGLAAVIQQHLAQGITDSYWWCALLDQATCKRCRNLHGQVYRYGDGPIPPLHFRCRCHISPLIGDDRPTKAGRDESFSAWLRRQPPEFREAAFGSKKNPEPVDSLARSLSSYAQTGKHTVTPPVVPAQ